jgi:hypothetical protein
VSRAGGAQGAASTCPQATGPAEPRGLGGVSGCVGASTSGTLGVVRALAVFGTTWDSPGC